MTKRKGNAAKKPKLEIKFDNDARREFLSGFHKRNLQKKAFYKTKLEKRLAEEKQRIRAEAKKSVGRASSSHSILPEVEKIIGFSQGDLEDERKIKSESFVLGTKTVTISSLDDIHTKLPPVDGNYSDSDDNSYIDTTPQMPQPQPNAKSMMKRKTNQLLQQSKAYKAALKFKQKSKKSRAKNRLARSGGTDSAKDKPTSSIVASGKRKISKQTKQVDPKSKKGKRMKVDPRRKK